MMLRGQVIKYVDERGFGFIRCEESNINQDVFFHVKDVLERRDLKVGARVTFKVIQGERGPVGTNIVPYNLRDATAAGWQPRAANGGPNDVQEFDFAQAAAGAVAICMSAIFFFSDVPIFLKYLSGIQIVTYFTYCEDKRRAMNGSWRIPEARLHFLALVGGTPAAFLAQEVLRHKTKKESFRRTQKQILIFQVLLILAIPLISVAFTQVDWSRISERITLPSRSSQ